MEPDYRSTGVRGCIVPVPASLEKDIKEAMMPNSGSLVESLLPDDMSFDSLV